MGDVKSQFVLGGYTQANYVLDSLNVMFADTRGGLTDTTATRLAAMQGYVTANPDKTNATQFGAYVGKLVGSAQEPEAKPAITLRTKPNAGIK